MWRVREREIAQLPGGSGIESVTSRSDQPVCWAAAVCGLTDFLPSMHSVSYPLHILGGSR